MSDKELKAENAAFKEWYINGGHLKAGRWSFTAIEISSGLRFAVMDNRKLQEIWRKEGKGYERVV
jgi:hypothetical protein